ncbi:MAG: RNA polymerase sigma-70 factor [Flavobacteriales bacterium]|nr:RNA polymerase sigma-70 factor [Flavobacteriales bacterium]
MSFIDSRSEFERAFRSHYKGLVIYATRMLRDQDKAEDAVQQVFVSLWEKRDQIEVQGNEMSYLMRSVHNGCLNQIKHEKVKLDHAAHEMHTGEEAHVEDALEQEEFRQKVTETVKGLPSQCRKIFLMSRIQGKKYHEIAEELELSVKTVENQMGKALRIMRTSLHEEVRATMRVIKTILWLTIGVKTASVVIQ